MKLDTIKLSFSALKAFSRSPAHFAAYKKRVFKQSAPMRRGWLTHALTLEPDKEHLVIDCKSRATKAFKEAVEEYGAEAVFTRTEYKEAQKLADAVHAHPLARKLIEEATSLEQHIHFEVSGVKFHGFADIIGKDYIADLKITDNEPKKLQRWVLDNLYHMQLALYSHGVFNSEAHIKHYLITCDPNAPYGVIVYELTAEVVEDGMNRAFLEVNMFKNWYEEWDGETTPQSYDYCEPIDTPMLLELPSWYK